jgi:iron complex outermembrane recepter protein
MTATSLPGRRGHFAASRFALISASLTFIASGAARADETGGDQNQIAEIIVTGEKMETGLQKAPEAITALSAEAMAENNIVNPLDLNGQVPGLVMTTSDFSRSVAIRGIGFNVPQDDAAQPSVSYHEDGIYIANPIALNSDFLDVDHIEVLRGPQGTAFGQNSIGGALNVITKQPTFDAITGDAGLAFGSYDLVHTNGAINIPLSDTFAIRGAFDQVYQHGWATATQVPGTNGDYPLNNQNADHFRLSALWQPIEALSVGLRAEYADAHQHEAEAKSIYDPDPDPWRETSDWPGALDYKQALIASTINYDSGFARFKSLTSWQAVNQEASVNEDGLDLSLTSPLHDVEWFLHNSVTVTQEFDVSSEPGGKLDWIAGAFFLDYRLHAGYDQYDMAVGDTYSPNLLSDTANPSPDTVAAIESGEMYFQSVADIARDSYSFFGQGIYHLLDDLRVTAGARYTFDHNSTWFTNFYNLFGPPEDVRQTATKVTWRIGLDYDLTPENLLYGSIATGFKPGSGNYALFPATLPRAYQPETITAYEVGSKNSFLAKTLTVNVASFYYLNKNQQFAAEDLINYNGGVDSIPKVRIYGIESELAALLPYHLRFDSNLTAENSKILSHFMALDNDAGNAANAAYIAEGGSYACFETGCPALNALRLAAFRDVYGNPSPMLPKITASGSLAHTLGFRDGSSLLSRFQVVYRDSYADTVFGETPVYKSPSYTLLDLYFDYVFANKAFDTSLSVTNLADRGAVVSRYTNQFGGETTQLYAPPREFIGRFGYRF